MAEERKLVTVLFADITGSTALGETLDPEDIRLLLSRYYAHARQIVSLHGGTLEKFIGDAVMAIFGLPQAHSDDAERGLAAALALRDAVANDTLLGRQLQLRIGVNTGEVVATSDTSSGDFLITGDAVNVAARLQQAANAGEIIVSERTAAATHAAFLFAESRVVEVKGKRQPLRIFPLMTARSTRQVGRPPFVGRKQDLLQLAVLQMRTVEEQRPQLISIMAPAGTGKTRLLEEFLVRLDPADGFRVATARCLPYGQTLSYWPMRSLLSDLLGEEITRPRILDAFIGGGQKFEDASRLTDLVMATLGVEPEVSADRESIFAAWRLLIEVLAHEAPRIIVFEDLHWASDSLLDLVEYITHLRTSAPLLMITLSRPELLDRRPNWGGGRQNFTAMSLQPLPPAQMRELVKRLMEGLTKELPEGTREQIAERSAGNPFFALELVRMLAERDLSGKLAPLDTLPDTVHAAVLARLDLLSSKARIAAQAAAVMGRSFQRELLQAVLAQLKPGEIEIALDELLLRDLIVPDEHAAFSFRHILIRDVAYGTLARPERISLHAGIAASLEKQAGDRQFAELIAYHYREAVRLSRQSAVPLALPFDPAHVIRALERAGELASRSGAFAEAYNDLQSALEIAPSSEQARLYEKLGDSIVFGDTAVNAYRQALERWQSSGASEPLIGARLLRKLLMGYMRFRPWVSMLPSTEEMNAMRAEAQRLVEQADDADERMSIRLANHTWWPASSWATDITVEEIHKGREVALAAAAYFEAHGDWTSLSGALDGYASLSRKLEAYEDVLKASQRRFSATRISAAERGDALASIVYAYAELGDYDRSLSTVHEALAGLRSGEPLEYLCIGVGAATWVAWISGRWSELDDLLTLLQGVWERVQYEPYTITTLAEGYWVSLALAMAREDRAAIDAAASVIEQITTPRGTVYMQALLKAFLNGDLSNLKLDVSQKEIGPGTLMGLNEFNVHLPPDYLARLASLRGVWMARVVEIAQSLAANDPVWLEAAIDRAEAHGLIPHAARMRIVLAQQLGSRVPLERARSVLEKLADRQFLRRLEEVESILP